MDQRTDGAAAQLVGVMWVALALMFEIGLGRSSSTTRGTESWSDFNLARGGFLAIGVKGASSERRKVQLACDRYPIIFGIIVVFRRATFRNTDTSAALQFLNGAALLASY